jgi:ABC-type transporter Mla subunit MlaD
VVFRAPLFVFSYQALSQVAPCRIAIPYEIVSIDPGFDVSKADVQKAARDAVAVWEKAAGRDLFVEMATGTPVIEVNLQYDLRQQTTETLKDLGTQISNSSAKYEDVQDRYETRRAVYRSKKEAFESAIAAFDRDAAAYQKEVDSWNARGGAPQSVVNRLNQEKAALQTRQQALTVQQREVNDLADEVNALARDLNAMATDINATARTYNDVGSQTGEEFEEGVFESRAGKETITVFEFDSQARLTRLLAHEFGHALGFDHVEGEDSIMYRLNQGSNISPTPDDLQELRRVCKIS